MRKSFTSIAISSVLSLSLLAVSQRAEAIEPYNDEAPFGGFSGNVELFQNNTPNTWGFGGSAIQITKGDTDYLVLTCAGMRNVKHVGITILNASADLDIAVYDMNGNYLTGSYGTGDREIATVQPFGKQSVVMKVYGYNYAYGSYSADIYCQE